MIIRPEKCANPEVPVLEFYKQLPFNYSFDISLSAVALLSNKPAILKFYVPIVDELLLQDGVHIMELGCGTGWLSTLLVYTDETMARSWFNDKVLHPHETQRTITEVSEVFKECGTNSI
jgi:hypothetical protein